jgi:hypothetical protein
MSAPPLSLFFTFSFPCSFEASFGASFRASALGASSAPRLAGVHHGTVLTVSACALFVEGTRLQSFARFRRARTRSAFALPS